MDLLTLLVDEPSKVLHRSFFAQGSTSIPIDPFDSITKKELKKKIDEALPSSYKDSDTPILTLYGHGRFHHYTYGLCSLLADKRSSGYTYIHIDQHHDMWSDSIGSINCGRFTRSLLYDTNAENVLLTGIRTIDDDCKGKDILHVPCKEGYEKMFKKTLENVSSEVYVSIDLDVLQFHQMQTGWSKGLMSFSGLSNIVEMILSSKKIIGADILGWDDARKRKKESLKVYKHLVEMFTGRQETKWQRLLGNTLTLL